MVSIRGERTSARSNKPFCMEQKNRDLIQGELRTGSLRKTEITYNRKLELSEA